MGLASIMPHLVYTTVGVSVLLVLGCIFMRVYFRESSLFTRQHAIHVGFCLILIILAQTGSEAMPFTFVLGGPLVYINAYNRLVIGPRPPQVKIPGRVAIVTGGNTGVGFHTAKLLAHLGAHVILACRSKTKGEKAVEEIKASVVEAKVSVMELDLCSRKSIRAFVTEFSKLNIPLNILVNNAGVMLATRSETSDGLETTMASNYFGHFLLTNLLLPKLKKADGARIINLSSSTHQECKGIDFEDLQIKKNYSIFKAYTMSKLAVNLFTLQLAANLKGTNVSCFVCHPGFVLTDITRGFPKWIIALYGAFRPIFSLLQSEAQHGAYTPVYLATSNDVIGYEGSYFIQCALATPSEASLDENAAKKLWKESEKLVGLSK